MEWLNVTFVIREIVFLAIKAVEHLVQSFGDVPLSGHGADVKVVLFDREIFGNGAGGIAAGDAVMLGYDALAKCSNFIGTAIGRFVQISTTDLARLPYYTYV